MIFGGSARWAYTAYLSKSKPNGASDPAPTPGGDNLGSSSLNKTNAYAHVVVKKIRAGFPAIKTIYGWRMSSAYSSDHPAGRALDIMIPSYKSSSAKALGDRIARYLQDNYKALHVHYIIWRQRQWNVERNTNVTTGRRRMSDRGTHRQPHESRPRDRVRRQIHPRGGRSASIEEVRVLAPRVVPHLDGFKGARTIRHPNATSSAVLGRRCTAQVGRRHPVAALADHQEQHRQPDHDGRRGPGEHPPFVAAACPPPPHSTEGTTPFPRGSGTPPGSCRSVMCVPSGSISSRDRTVVCGYGGLSGPPVDRIHHLASGGRSISHGFGRRGSRPVWFAEQVPIV